MEKDETSQKSVPDGMPPVQNLKALRESRGIRLKDIFEATRITVVNLEAIESGRFGDLPAPVIARSFIRTYARTVGADEVQLLERYNRYLGESQAPAAEAKPAPPKKSSPKKMIVAISFLALALLVAAAVLMLREPVKAPSAPSTPATAPAAKPADTAPPAPVAPAQVQAPPGGNVAPAPTPGAPATAPAQPPASPPAPTPAAAAPAQGYTLVIEARDYTWIRLSEDQGQPYQVTLKPGEKLERHAGRSFDIDIGNAGGTQLIFQGKPIGPLGSPGQVVHVRLP